MKKTKTNQDKELRPSYDSSSLRKGVRGKYLDRYNSGTNLVLLAPDVAAAFPTEQAVNDALRGLINTGDGSVKPAA